MSASSSGVGTSENSDAFTAGKEALEAAYAQAERNFFDLILVFASVKFNQQALLRGIQSLAYRATIIGCSTAGEISTNGSAENSVVVMGLKSAVLSFATGLGSGISRDARLAGQRCAQETIKTQLANRRLFIMFADGLAENGADVIRGAQEVLGTSFPIVGGSAGDNYLFQKTYQYHQDKPLSDAVVGLLLAGNISIGIGTRHGWHPIGKAHQVTSASGNIIHKIDNKDAFRMYQEYFAREADTLKSMRWAKIGTIYPLGMSIPDEEEYLIRYVFKATNEGALVCAAEVPQDSWVRLMISDQDGVLNAAKEATLKAKEALGNAKPLALIVFDSIARKRILGRHSKKEIEIIKAIMGQDCPLIGFYSYGEQAPLEAQRYIGISHFHNETVVVIAIGEA